MKRLVKTTVRPKLYAALPFAALLLACSAVTSVRGQSPTPTSAPTIVEPLVEESPIPTKNLLEVYQAGGLLMHPILLCSFVLLVVVFERSVALRRGRVIPRPFVKRFMQQLRDGQLDQGQALVLCEENASPVARVLGGAAKKWGRPAVEVEQGIIDAGERVSNDLRRYLRVMNGISTVGPLLGLLGTVTGMIAAFNAISTTGAMGRPELLAAGISEALLTTAFGLIVAIPALILYLWFVGKVDKLIIEIDGLGEQLVELISAEALQDGRLDRSRAAAKKAKVA